MWRRFRLDILALWAVLAGLSFGFARTEGLVYADPGIPFTHVKQLQSSGSNDDLCIEIGVAFGLLGVLWGALRMRRRFGIADVAANGALVVAQAVYLFAIEAGSIPQTIARDRNWVLGAWLATFAALAIWVGLAAIRASMAASAGTDAASQ
jgi:hypothetical protein